MKAIYAKHAPQQTVTIRVKKGDDSQLVEVILMPGKEVELPDGHTFTRKMIGNGYLVDGDGKALELTAPEVEAMANADAQQKEQVKSPSQLGRQKAGSDDRIAAIMAALSNLDDEDRDDKGQPKPARVTEMVGFKVSPDEIQTAVEAVAQGEPS